MACLTRIVILTLGVPTSLLSLALGLISLALGLSFSLSLSPSSSAQVDTGMWKPMGSVRQLKWMILSDGLLPVSPAEHSRVAVAILRRMVNMHIRCHPTQVQPPPPIFFLLSLLIVLCVVTASQLLNCCSHEYLFFVFPVSVDTRGIPYHPIPFGKRVVSSPESLAMIAQLTLSNSPELVEEAALLLSEVLEFNAVAQASMEDWRGGNEDQGRRSRSH